MKRFAATAIPVATLALTGCAGFTLPEYTPPPDTFKIACEEISGEVMESSTDRDISGPISGSIGTWVSGPNGSTYASGWAYGTGHGTVTITERLCVDDGGNIRDMELK